MVADGTPRDDATGQVPEPIAAGEFEVLLARHLPQLHAFVHARLGPSFRWRETTQDVVQSVCRELLEHRPGAGVHGDDRFRAWLFTVALNKIRAKSRMHHAGRRDVDRERDLADAGALAELQHVLTPSREAIGQETAAHVAAALAALTAEQREIVTLARVVGLPHAVIAEFLGITEDTARQRLLRALLALGDQLRRRGVVMPS